MTTNQPDRLDQLQTLLADFIAASTADRQASNERMTRIEEARERDRRESNERMTRLETSMTAANAKMDRFEALVETSYEPVQALLEASAEHQTRIARQDALIERLDAILERMIYREGRGGNDEPH